MYFRDKVEGLIKLFGILRRLPLDSYRLNVAGNGPYMEMALKACEGVSVDFLGFVPVRNILSENDIFVYYSDHDNFPNAILEAMASGLPVITNKVGAVSEIITSGEDGHIAEDEEDYLFTLNCLRHSASLRTEMGAKARGTVESKFDWDDVVDDYIGIYRSLN
jgi:glycosyltransferase involved in cell wall biosynthesis